MIKVIGEYPNMDVKVGDVITLPSDSWVFADGKYCTEDYFLAFPLYFELVKPNNENL